MSSKPDDDSIPGDYDTLSGIKQRAEALENPVIATLVERAEGRIIEYDGGGYGIGAPDAESDSMEMLFHFGILAGAALERDYPAPESTTVDRTGGGE